MADSLFGPSPAQILYARQKDLADRQAEDYRTYLATAQTPAERTSIMAGRTLTQGFAPLLGLGAGAKDPMLQQASMTQNIISKYGADALTNPDTLDQMAAEFKASGMNNEAFQLAARAADIRSKIKTPKRTSIKTGRELRELNPERYSGVINTYRYEVDEAGNATPLTTAKEMPALVAGEEYVYDEDPTSDTYGQPLGVRARPGSKLDLERKAGELAERKQNIESAAGFANVLQTIQSAREIVSKFWYATGLPARVLNRIGWSGANTEVGAKVQTIRSNLGLASITKLKELSPTGSTGLGQVSNIELNSLQSAIADLNQSLTEEAFIRQLDVIEGHYIRLVNTLNEELDEASILASAASPERKEALLADARKIRQLYIDAGLLRADGSDPATTPDKPNVKDYRPEGARTSTEEERRASGTITMGQQ